MTRLKRLATTLSGNDWAVLAILAAVGMLAYMPALQGEFLWDDHYLVQENPFFKSPIFIFEVFRHYLFLDSLSAYYRPVQNISYMLDYWLWNTNSYGYHLSNVVYHVLCAFLLYLLLKKLLPTLRGRAEAPDEACGTEITNNMIASLVALVWVAHPIHNAAVAYVAGRADSLACMFALSAWLLFLRAARSPAIWLKGLLQGTALLFCLLGLCSKEIAFIWMALFLFHLFFFSPKKSLWEKIRALIAIGLVIGCYAWMRHLPGGGGGVGGDDPRPFTTRCIVMLRALGDYMWLIFYPADLHMERTVFTANAYRSLADWEGSIRFEYLSIIGSAMIAIFAIMARSNRPGQHVRILGIAWFVLGFLPISNLFPLNAQAAEHWIYMPSMGFLLFLAGCVLALPVKYRVWPACAALLALVPLVARTYSRSCDWADSERFYRQTVAAGGGSTRINLNLALVYSGRGEFVKAEQLLRDIVRRFPDYMPARINLGINLRLQGKDNEATEYLKYDKKTSDLIARQYTNTWKAAQHFAQILFEEKKYDDSLALLDDAIRRHPDVWDLVQCKAEAFRNLGRLPDAIRIVKQYSDSNWWHYRSSMMLAHLEFAHDDTDAGIAMLKHAALLDIHAAGKDGPYNLLAEVYLNLKRPEDAYLAQMKAIRRDPDQPLQYIMLAHILDLLHRDKEAAAALQHADEMRASVIPAQNRG